MHVTKIEGFLVLLEEMCKRKYRWKKCGSKCSQQYVFAFNKTIISMCMIRKTIKYKKPMIMLRIYKMRRVLFNISVGDRHRNFNRRQLRSVCAVIGLMVIMRQTVYCKQWKTYIGYAFRIPKYYTRNHDTYESRMYHIAQILLSCGMSVI